jgi:hypothetical protein
VSANASDNRGVAGVQFKLDGANLGAEERFAPYAISWNTATAGNGPHTITAVARDAAGNRTTSEPVTVTVNNDTTPPTVGITSPASGVTVSGPLTVTASASDNVGVVGVQLKYDGANGSGNFGAELTTAPYSFTKDTAAVANGSYTLTAVARDAAGNLTVSAPVAVTVANDNPIVAENRQLGSTGWRLGPLVADDVGKQIKGYASATSVGKGGSLSFHVTVTPAQRYSIDIYRIGWYGGLGGRLLQQVGPFAGATQPACPPDRMTGLIACEWPGGYTLTVPSDWTSGIYAAVLTNASGWQNYVIFVVTDGRPAPFLYQQSVTTYQAYNNYPNDRLTGKSLYQFNSVGAAATLSSDPRAVKVSFDRPYSDNGGGQFGNWEIYFVRWLERTGYDVTYSTDLDTHSNGANLKNHRVFLSVGHDEYWSKEMFDAAESARDAGVNLGFFGANAVYWQVRFEPAATGAPNRVMVCYKEAQLDPVQGPTTTVLFRSPQVNRPEQTLIGIQFTSFVESDKMQPYVVINNANPIYSGTGFRNGNSVPGIVGYEMDRYMPEYPLPPHTDRVLLGESPFVDVKGLPDHANSSLYRAPSSAWVFAAGTIAWSWGLDDIETFRADRRIQKATANIFGLFLDR